MAASQSLTEGLPPSDKPSFANMVRGTSSVICEPLKEASLHKGEPALLFSDPEVAALSTPLRFALIGKFIADRPSMEFIRRGFKTIGFKGDFRLGLMDPRHILIRFDLEDDYHRCWLHNSWRFKDHVMKILKWTPDFSAKEEPPIVPVWVSFDQLPLFLFARSPLFSLGRILGTPLKLDAATLSLSRPSVARLCVELDLRNALPSRIWIGLGHSGFWQPVTYEHLPDYCFDCHSLGHSQSDCGQQISLAPKANQIWRVKSTSQTTSSQPPHVDLVQPQPPIDSLVQDALPTPSARLDVPTGLALIPEIIPLSVGGVVHVHATVDEQLHGSVHPQCSKSTVAEEAPTEVLHQVSSQIAAPNSGIPSTTEKSSSEKTSIPVHHVDVPSTSGIPSSEKTSIPVHHFDIPIPHAAPSSPDASQDLDVPLNHSEQATEMPSIHHEDFTGPSPVASAPGPSHGPAVGPASIHSDSDVDEVFDIVDAPLDQATVMPSVHHEDFTALAADTLLPIFPGVSDDLQLGASAKMYSPALIQMRSARHLPVSARTREDIYADLRSFAQPVPCKSDLRAFKVNQPPPGVVAGPSDGYNIAAVLPMATSSISQPFHVQNSSQFPLAPDIGYNDSEYYQDTQGSEELGHDDYEDTDDHTYDDITDGSEGTHMQKKKDRRRLKGFTDQSRLLNKRMSKRGRPPGSRNRTYFDIPRTMSTRATRVTSD